MRQRLVKGFTLLEMSMVLVIIGLVVGGILAGKALIRSAHVRAQVAQVTSFGEATNAFKLKYGVMAGDMKPARAVELGFITRAGGVGCGNGNNAIEGVTAGGDIQSDCSTAGSPAGGSIGNEWFYFWADLSQAQLVGFGYDNASMTTSGGKVSTNLQMGNVLPLAKMGQGYGYVAIGGGGLDKPLAFYMLNFAGNSVNGTPRSSIPTVDAQAYDTKVDDGLPYSGSVIAINPQDGTNINYSIQSNAAPTPKNLMACYRPKTFEAFLGSLVVSPAYADGCDPNLCQTDDGNGGCQSTCTGNDYCSNINGVCCSGNDLGCQHGTFTDGNGCPFCAQDCDSNACTSQDGYGGCTAPCPGGGTCNGAGTCCIDPGYCPGGTYMSGGCPACAQVCNGNACEVSDGNGGCTSNCTTSGYHCNMTGGCDPDPTPDCGSGSHWNGWTCVADPTPDCGSCAYWDSGSSQCISTLQGQQTCVNGNPADPTCNSYGACETVDGNHNCTVSCGAGTTCNGTGSCVSVCNGCQTWDGMSCQSNCLGSQYCDGNSCQGFICNPNSCTSWDGSQCVSTLQGQQTCSDGNPVEPNCTSSCESVDGSHNCTSFCGAGTTCNGIGQCVSVCGECQTWNGSSCDNDCHGSQYCSGGICQGSACSVSDCQVWDGTQCVDSCTGGRTCNMGTCNCNSNACMEWDADSQSCVSNCHGNQYCSEGMCQGSICTSVDCQAWDGTQCVSACTGGRTCNNETGFGVCECNSGACMRWDENTQQCVNACVGDQTCDQSTDMGRVIGTCHDPVCEDCTVMDPQSHTCVSTCGADQYCAGGLCSCAADCTVASGTDCVPRTCAGEQYCSLNTCYDPTCDTANCMVLDSNAHTCVSRCSIGERCDGSSNCLPDETATDTPTDVPTDTPTDTPTSTPDDGGIGHPEACTVGMAYAATDTGLCIIKQNMGM